MDLSQIGPNLIKLITTYWRVYLIDGVTATLQFTCIAVSLGVVLGTLIAILKMSKFKIVRFLVSIYIEVIRGTPILLQLYIFYFVLPSLFPFLNLSQFMWVAIAMCVNSGAYVSEVIRSGIQAVDKGQTEAARSLGLNKTQTMMKIILPQAVRNILPALGNEFIMILKETSLASTFFLGDLMTSHKIVTGATYLQLESLIIVGAVYLCITFPLSKLVEWFEKKMANGKAYKNHNRKRKLKAEKGIKGVA
jgi:His/Glu/Gln/Arg/opine family amino acid ABC transporter permease subunit